MHRYYGSRQIILKDLGEAPATGTIRVTRTIVLEGQPAWVQATLDKSWVAPGEPRILANGASIKESSYLVEVQP